MEIRIIGKPDELQLALAVLHEADAAGVLRLWQARAPRPDPGRLGELRQYVYVGIAAAAGGTGAG